MLLLTPGPTPVPDEIVSAMARPIVPHRGPDFTALLARVRPNLSRVFATSGPVLAFAGSGTIAMESALWSLTRPGDATCSIACGRFGERWGGGLDRFAHTFGGARAAVHGEWGSKTDLDRVADALTPETRIVTLVQSETSTGARTDLRAVAEIVRERAPEALIVADVVTGVAAIEMQMDAWGIDACVAASQKALMLPPGLGFVALSERAIERLRAGESTAPMSMDLRWRLDAYEKGTVANTPPVSLWFGLEQSLGMILAEGLAARHARVSRIASRVRAELGDMGFTPAAAEPVDSVTAAFYPDGVDDSLRAACRERGVEFSGGQDAWSGRVLRVSHMGAVDEAMTDGAMGTVRACLDR